MKLQSEPAGQQMAEIAMVLLIGRHWRSIGQQKSDGKDDPHCLRLEFPPHVSARGIRPTTWAADTAVARARAEVMGIVADIRQMSESCWRLELRMLAAVQRLAEVNICRIVFEFERLRSTKGTMGFLRS
jgi:hypothetical protein